MNYEITRRIDELRRRAKLLALNARLMQERSTRLLARADRMHERHAAELKPRGIAQTNS